MVKQIRKSYKSDLSDKEWQIIEPHIPKPKTKRGRKREHPLRKIMNAIFYVVRSGCVWHLLPHDFPPWKTVYHYFRIWRLGGIWVSINVALRTELRVAVGKNPEPSAAILDSQSVKTSETPGIRGYDAGKKVKGRKRHILVDTMGLLLVVVVHAANIQDRDGGKLVLEKVKGTFSRLILIWADGGYVGQLVDWAKAIVNLSPDLSSVANLLGTNEDTVRTVLNSWGPGKFDAELFLDGKAFNPQQVTDNVTTGTNVPGATLIPNALGLAGFNQHTWTGAWGTIPYWNALVANLEMHGNGTFFDPRLNNAAKFPIAAKNGFGNVRTDPDSDMITSKLPALQFYQLAIPSPVPQPGVDFNKSAAQRGDELFGGKAKCITCHVEPLWTEPGWNLHTPDEIGIDSFQADRAPDGVYKTMNLGGIFVREEGINMKDENKGRFYHDGRFKTLLDVVNHYDKHFNLGLTDMEKSDLVEYLKSLSSP